MNSKYCDAEEYIYGSIQTRHAEQKYNTDTKTFFVVISSISQPNNMFNLKSNNKTLNMMMFERPIDSLSTRTCVAWKKEMNEIDFCDEGHWCLTSLKKQRTKTVQILPLGCCVPTFYLELYPLDNKLEH